ncbi:hypothetical protein Tco_0190875 [Tanacetum coccineum]
MESLISNFQEIELHETQLVVKQLHSVRMLWFEQLETHLSNLYHNKLSRAADAFKPAFLATPFTMYMYCDPETYRRNLIEYLDMLVDVLHESVLQYGILRMKENEVNALKENGRQEQQCTHKQEDETQLQQHECLVTESTTLEAKVSTDVKALDGGMVAIDSNGTYSDKHDTSSSSRNHTTQAVDADIGPVNDEEPFAEDARKMTQDKTRIPNHRDMASTRAHCTPNACTPKPRNIYRSSPPIQRRQSGIAFRDSFIVSKKRSSDSSKKLKGIQTLTPAEQEAADIMKALKESKKISKRQPGTGGSNEGTGNILGVPDESTVVSRASSEGTGSKPGVKDEPGKTTMETEVESMVTVPIQQVSSSVPLLILQSSISHLLNQYLLPVKNHSLQLSPPTSALQQSRLAPSPVPATTYIPPTDKDLEILFQPMFDEYFDQSTDSEPVPTATVVNAPIVSTNTSVSTTIAQDALLDIRKRLGHPVYFTVYYSS